MKELLEMDDMFLPYDYTKQNKAVATLDDEEEEEAVTAMKKPSPSSPNNLLRRMGGTLDQSRYKSQGYSELSNTDADDLPHELSAVTHNVAAAVNNDTSKFK